MKNQMWNKKPSNNIEALRLAMALVSNATTPEQHHSASNTLFSIADMCSEQEVETALIQEGMWDVILNGLADNGHGKK
jgi:hypothetical protein